MTYPEAIICNVFVLISAINAGSAFGWSCGWMVWGVTSLVVTIASFFLENVRRKN